jgi:hypothetical protein
MTLLLFRLAHAPFRGAALRLRLRPPRRTAHLANCLFLYIGMIDGGWETEKQVVLPFLALFQSFRSRLSDLTILLKHLVTRINYLLVWLADLAMWLEGSAIRLNESAAWPNQPTTQWKDLSM